VNKPKKELPVIAVILYIAAIATAVAAIVMTIFGLPILFFEIVPELRDAVYFGFITRLEFVAEFTYYFFDYIFRHYIYALILWGIGVAVRTKA